MSSRLKTKPAAGRFPADDLGNDVSKVARLGDWAPALLKSQAYEQLLLDIVSGELEPGEYVDPYQLAQHYQCGLAGIRDALARLALEGLVQRRPRIGTIVAPLDIMQIKQAFEARFLIEPHCAGLAALHATRSEIAQIKSAFDGAEAAIQKGDTRKMMGMDRNFHFAVAFASHNMELARTIVTLHHKAARFWVLSSPGQSKQERLDDVIFHRAVAAAIEARDVAKAQSAMLKVLGNFPNRVDRTLAGDHGLRGRGKIKY